MGYSTSSPELKPTLTDVFNQSHSYLPKRVPFNPSPSLGELMKRDLKWKPLFVPVIQGFWSYTRSKHSSHIIIKAHTTRAEACFSPSICTRSEKHSQTAIDKRTNYHQLAIWWYFQRGIYVIPWYSFHRSPPPMFYFSPLTFPSPVHVYKSVATRFMSINVQRRTNRFYIHSFVCLLLYKQCTSLTAVTVVKCDFP